MNLVALVVLSIGQISVPSELEPFEPIRAGCDCIVPDGASVAFLWRTSDNAQHEVVADGKKIHVWAPPGEHWIETTVIVQQYEDVVVLIPDPEHPTDPTKATLKTIRMAKDFTADQYSARFKVKGTVPQPDPIPPTPGPTPPPGPNPPGPSPGPNPLPDGFAAEIRKLYQATPAYTKELALSFAENYASVGSQGSDSARNSGWVLATFVNRTKALHTETTPTATLDAWREPFFRPLAEMHSKMFAQRGLTVNDKEKIAALWTETAEAMKTAAY